MAFARRSVVSRVIDGDAEVRESALVAFVAASQSGHSTTGNVDNTAAAHATADTNAAKIVDGNLIDSPPVYQKV